MFSCVCITHKNYSFIVITLKISDHSTISLIAFFKGTLCLVPYDSMNLLVDELKSMHPRYLQKICVIFVLIELIGQKLCI